jgi:death-on-curing protein
MSRAGSRSRRRSSIIDTNWRGPEKIISFAIWACLKAPWPGPRSAFAYGEEDIVVLAVALMAGISRAHAFEQGNKRTAFAAMRLFLRANGYDTAFDDAVSWADEMISLIEHRSTEEDFAAAIRSYVVPRS